MSKQLETLTKDAGSDSDYTLNDNSVWITVKGFSLHIIKMTEGIEVNAYKAGDEWGETIAGLWASDEDAKNA